MTKYFLQGGRDVISHRKVLPSVECTQSVRPLHLPAAFANCPLAIFSTVPDPLACTGMRAM